MTKNFNSNHYLSQLIQEKSNIANFQPQKSNCSIKLKKIIEKLQFGKNKSISLDQNKKEYYILRNKSNKQYIKLSSEDKYIWSKIDGKNTIFDLSFLFYHQYGIFAFEKITNFIFLLEKNNFIEQVHHPIYQKIKHELKKNKPLFKILTFLKRIGNYQFCLPKADQFFTFIYKKFFRIFFNKTISLILILIAFIGPFLFLYESKLFNINLLYFENSISLALIILFLANLLGLTIHELAHGLATKHFKRNINQAGLMLYLGLPVFYVDTSDMWLENKKRRILVSIIGPFTELILAGLVTILLLFISPGSIASILYRYVFVSYLSVLLNLNPLLEWDGYFILIDLFETPALKKKSFYYLKKKLKNLIRNKKNIDIKIKNIEPKQEKFYLFYALTSSIATIITLIFVYYFWKNQLQKLLLLF